MPNRPSVAPYSRFHSFLACLRMLAESTPEDQEHRPRGHQRRRPEATDASRRFQRPPEPRSTWVDFGKVVTDGSVKINKEGRRLVLFPYPRDRQFRVGLDAPGAGVGRRPSAPCRCESSLQARGRTWAQGSSNGAGPTEAEPRDTGRGPLRGDLVIRNNVRVMAVSGEDGGAAASAPRDAAGCDHAPAPSHRQVGNHQRRRALLRHRPEARLSPRKA